MNVSIDTLAAQIVREASRFVGLREVRKNSDWDNPTTFINIARLPELNKVAALSSGAGRIEFGAGQIEFGAAVTLSTIIEVLKASAATLGPAEAGRVALESAVRHLMLVAHYQVRDVASWAGNLILAKSHPFGKLCSGQNQTCHGMSTFVSRHNTQFR
jgi:hypothetical protein